MKAAVYRPGVVQIRDVPMPVPKDKEVLVRIQATTICAADYRLKTTPHALGWVMGLWRSNRTTILGMELSGTVEALGPGASRFRLGDAVFGGTGFKLGAHAEYACVPEFQLELRPSNMTAEESAAVSFGGLTALYSLRKARLQGQNVLIYGASGSVGVFAVQLAKHFGARVTAVCSTANVEMVRAIGADVVVDYTKEDFSRSGRVYDTIVDTVGKAGISRTLKALKRGGPIIGIGVDGDTMSRVLISILRTVPVQLWLSLTGAAKPMGGVTKPEPGDLAFLKGLIEAGQLKTVIDRCYPLDQIEEAHLYAARGHKKGHVVIRVAMS